MHFTETIYRNPYWPTYPLPQVTQGCTHNKCKFCTMYKGVPFRMQPMEWIRRLIKRSSMAIWIVWQQFEEIREHYNTRSRKT